VVKQHAEGGEGQANFELSDQMALRQYLFSFVHDSGCWKKAVCVYIGSAQSECLL